MFERLNIPNLCQHLILANTPFYLYKNYYKDGSVQGLSLQESAQNLKDEFDRRLKEGLNEIEDFAIIYAIVVALSLKEAKDVCDFFNRLHETKILWGSNLKDIYLSKKRSESIIQFNNSYTLPENATSNNSISANSLIRTRFHPINLKITE